MNKLAILSILFGLVAVVSAASVDLEDNEQFSELSEFKIRPNDDDETSFLSEEHQIFTDYCRRSRDLVYTYIQDKNREIVADIFATFFGSITDVTQQLEEIQAAAAEKATQTIKDGVEPLPEGEEITREQAEEHIEKSVGLLKSVGGALSSYARALADAAMQQLLTRLTLLKQTINSENFKELLTQTCTNIQLVMQPKLQAMFKETKAEINRDAPSKEMKEMLAQATYENVACLTTSRARKVVNVCGIFNTAGPLVFTMMGI